MDTAQDHRHDMPPSAMEANPVSSLYPERYIDRSLFANAQKEKPGDCRAFRFHL
jgi:hypothetical protein